jgi:hypothetical protein
MHWDSAQQFVEFTPEMCFFKDRLLAAYVGLEPIDFDLRFSDALLHPSNNTWVKATKESNPAQSVQ